MPVKTVTLSEDAYAALAALKREGESFSEVVRRLARTGRSLLEFAGAWKDFPSEKMDRYLAFLEAGDRESRAKLARELRRGRKCIQWRAWKPHSSLISSVTEPPPYNSPCRWKPRGSGRTVPLP